MPLPDMNLTIAAALYGAARGVALSRAAFLAEEHENLKADNETKDVSAVESTDPLTAYGENWMEAPESTRFGFMTLARFLNSYSHSSPVASLDRVQTGMSLVGIAKETTLHPLGLPYAALVEVFIAIKQALS